MEGQKVFPVILEYCGGSRTDALYNQLVSWNPKYRINVLDNASPLDRACCVTHTNSANSYIGGGIQDCITLADMSGHPYVLIIMNDVELLTPLYIHAFESIVESSVETIQVSASFTHDTPQVSQSPWMARRDGQSSRLAPHSDILCCLLRIDFIKSFGGFPPSKAGWGYDLELACQANWNNKSIVIVDDCVARHGRDRSRSIAALGEAFNKRREMQDAYRARYGDFEALITNMWSTLRDRYSPETSCACPSRTH